MEYEEEGKRGWLAIFLSLMFILIVMVLLSVYWFFPRGVIKFESEPMNSNFSLSGFSKGEIQFYPNMRYVDKEISYKIYDCPLQKKNRMEGAFGILENKSVVGFYPVESGEEISVTCDSKNKFDGGLFILGEGGPSKIIKSKEFNVILNGEILLIKDSKCGNPNVALHELLHALGFEHSDNSKNIMYNISECGQEIGGEIIELLNELYSIPSYPDIVLENVSAVMNGRYLNVNMTIMNGGLKSSEDSGIFIYADDKLVQEINLDEFDVGSGRTISLTELWINQLSVNKLEFIIESNFEELDKKNNKIILEIKKEK